MEAAGRFVEQGRPSAGTQLDNFKPFSHRTDSLFLKS